MIDQLRKTFTTLRQQQHTNETLDPHYKWFMTEAHDIIGIHEKELTAKDEALLQAFLTPYEIQFPPLTNEEKKWQAVIHQDKEQLKIEGHPAYRFVYFSINRNQISPLQFKTAICEVFGREVPILWENEHEGILIEEKLIHEEITSYAQIINVLMSDLYVKIRFLVGNFQQDIVDIQQDYRNLLMAADVALPYSDQNVMTYIDAIPYLFIQQTTGDQRRAVGESILRDYANDAETLKMIKTFVACNLNISETAKALHMHRNSLQYRLDRFYENTGLDIRKFHHAMTVYLALLSHNIQDAQKND